MKSKGKGKGTNVTIIIAKPGRWNFEILVKKEEEKERVQQGSDKLSLSECHPGHAWLIAFAQKKRGIRLSRHRIPHLELNLNFIYVTSFTYNQLVNILKICISFTAV